MAISLKTQNVPILVIYVVWCLSLYAVFLTGVENFWQKLISFFDYFNAKDCIVASLSPLVVFVLSGIVSADLKSILVFWRFKNVLPGHRAFTNLGPKDARIDMNKVEQVIGNIPEEPKDQNSVWYKYYKKYQDCLIVKTSHKHYLLSRDLTGMTLVMIIVLPWSILFVSKHWITAVSYFSVMAGHYLVLALVAQNYGERFVCNVLAEMITSQEGLDKKYFGKEE